MICENQKELLLLYMTQHMEFAKGHITKLGPQGQIKFNSMWKELADTLNGLGPSKSPNEWKKMIVNFFIYIDLIITITIKFKKFYFLGLDK